MNEGVLSADSLVDCKVHLLEGEANEHSVPRMTKFQLVQHPLDEPIS